MGHRDRMDRHRRGPPVAMVEVDDVLDASLDGLDQAERPSARACVVEQPQHVANRMTLPEELPHRCYRFVTRGAGRIRKSPL
jgi:hypothetical protein